MAERPAGERHDPLRLAGRRPPRPRGRRPDPPHRLPGRRRGAARRLAGAPALDWASTSPGHRTGTTSRASTSARRTASCIEIATDPPGFAVDERRRRCSAPSSVPPWLDDSAQRSPIAGHTPAARDDEPADDQPRPPPRTLGPAGGRTTSLNSVIGPRPIAWVSTVAPDGTFNVAPHSYTTVVLAKPPDGGVRQHRPKGHAPQRRGERRCSSTTSAPRALTNGSTAARPTSRATSASSTGRGLTPVPERAGRAPARRRGAGRRWRASVVDDLTRSRHRELTW